MQLEYFGGNCVKIATKKVAIVVDDNLKKLGQPNITKQNDISVFTNKQIDRPKTIGQFVVDRPGEYEVLDVSIQGISARAHVDEESKKSATVYRLVVDDIKIGVLGHIYPELSEDQLEALGMIDVLIVPVGGNGYTLDSLGALKLIKKVSPKIVVPTHYADKSLKYEVPQTALDEALKGLAMEPAETLDSLKLKGRDFDESTKLIVLKNSNQ